MFLCTYSCKHEMEGGDAWQERLQQRNDVLKQIEEMKLLIEEQGSEATDVECKAHESLVDALWKEYQAAHVSLMRKCRGEPISREFSKQAMMAAKTYSAVGKLLERESQSMNQHARARCGAREEVKLDKFSGEIAEWAVWKAHVMARLMSSNMPPAAKIDCLLGALEGEAALVAGTCFDRDETDFNRIWGKLNRTYENEYHSVFAHISKIVYYAPIAKATYQNLRTLIDTVDNHLELLKRYDVCVEKWGPLVAFTVISKLDVETRRLWGQELPGTLNRDTLWTFLEKRIHFLRNENAMTFESETSANHKSVSGPFRNSKPSRGASNRPTPYKSWACIACNELGHSLFACASFKNLSVGGRKELLAKHSMCEACLRRKLNDHDCQRSLQVCRKCHIKGHCDLLCMEDK